METESVRDVLHWSTKFHASLAYRLDKSQDEAVGERERLLMNYLSEHEQLLADNYMRYQKATEMKALKTWSYEYSNTFPKGWMQDFQSPYSDMTSQEIILDVEAQHNSLIEFYQHLKRHAHISEVVDLIDQLIDMEVSEAGEMTEASNRLEDM